VIDAGAQGHHADVFAGDGEMARRCRELDWTNTALGPVGGWPAALRTAVQMALECPFALSLWCGPDLVLLYNDAYRSALGAKHPRALGQPGRDVWSEIWPAIGPMFDAIRAGGPGVFAENARFAMERTAGSPDDAWFTFSLSPVRSEAGEIVAFLNVAAEMTSHVRADEEMGRARTAAEHAEHRLREVFSQAPAFLAVLSGPDHVVDFVNDAYQQLVGHRDLIGRTLANALPEVVAQGFVAILDRVLATREPFVGRDVSVSLQRVPGAAPEERFLDFVYQPIADEAGAPIGVVVHGSDVTDALMARREIERLWHESESTKFDALESESRYRFLANAIPVQVWTATPQGALDYVSDRTAEYFGKTTQQVIGEQWLAVLHPEDVSRTTERWVHSLRSGEPYEVEFRLWSAEHADYRWHLGRATAQRGEDGAIIRWFGTNTEIEDRVRAEAELTRLTHEATEANRAKGDFLAAMSHELRTPLNAIGGYAQLIEMGVRGPVTEEQRVDLLKIQRSKNHLDSLVSDVLSFAKLGAGRIEFRVHAIDVAATVDSVLEMTAPQLEQKQLELSTFNPSRDLKMIADEDKVRQILLNLLANALKFTPPHGRLTLAVHAADREVAISVTDTGIGIPADQLERIFEPFVQAKRALQPSDAGVGLGLAISRQLARAMSGDLSVSSRPGEGSTFTLRLPRSTET
jgi:PAS domain S-box-containing protein